jgi:DNA transformation protein
MGVKGDRLTRDSVISAELLVEKLGVIDGITSKKMFGGHGIFHEGKMFGLIDSKGKAFMKVDDTNRADFEVVNASQHSKMPYFSIPNAILNDQEALVEWAEKSISASK